MEKFLELDVVEGIPSQSNERVEPMDVISLPLLASDVNLEVRSFDSTRSCYYKSSHC